MVLKRESVLVELFTWCSRALILRLQWRHLVADCPRSGVPPSSPWQSSLTWPERQRAVGCVLSYANMSVSGANICRPAASAAAAFQRGGAAAPGRADRTSHTVCRRKASTTSDHRVMLEVSTEDVCYISRSSDFNMFFDVQILIFKAIYAD